MSSRRKKTKTAELDHDDEQVFASVVDDLAEAVIEELKDEHVNALEPFEQYAYKIRGKIHKDFKTFRSRFAKGYNALIEELVHEREDQGKSHSKDGDGS